MTANSTEYDAFVEKFKPRNTSDDCFTPENVYRVALNWAANRYGFDPAKAVRPFWPGRDYTQAEYPDGCVVVDNPPFSIISQIVRWYNEHGILFFLFCPGLSALALAKDKRSATIHHGCQITYDNGAVVNSAFVTNLEPDAVAISAPDLHDAIEEAEKANVSRMKRHVRRLRHPHAIATSSDMNYLAVHHTPHVIRKADAEFVRKLDCGVQLFGGAFLLNERAAAGRAAAERAAAERAAATTLSLSDREIAMQRSIGS